MLADAASTAAPAGIPAFPHFRPLALADREIFRRVLWDYQPQLSELTFTNLFIWQNHYGYRWSRKQDWLLVIGDSETTGPWALPPLGPSPRAEISLNLLDWLRTEHGPGAARIERADQRLVSELADAPGLVIEPQREHFDYVYHSEDLINLAGGKYHSRRNYLNTFERTYKYRYEVLEERHLARCRDFIARWCKRRRCSEDLSLMGEWEAIGAALNNFSALELQGAAILIAGAVEAFTLGELLNKETAVIHIEKANPEIRASMR